MKRVTIKNFEDENLFCLHQGIKKIEELDCTSLPVLLAEPMRSRAFSGLDILLACRSYPGVEQFFFEMIAKFLFPGRIVSFSFSFSSRFFFEAEECVFCEVRVPCLDGFDLEEMIYNFQRIASELRLGLSSFYQGRKVLELQGRFSSDKNGLIQERVAYILAHQPSYFDYDLFGQMQHFFAYCTDLFKETHSVNYLSRIIAVLYLFRKEIRRQVDKTAEERHVLVKTCLTRISTPFGEKKALGVLLGMSLYEHEIFSEKHLSAAVEELIGPCKVINGSHYIYFSKEDGSIFIHLEFSCEKGSFFSAMRLIRKYLCERVKGHVEKVMPALFMPRNEEEVLKNIVLLSDQLKYVKDLPQVIISFERQEQEVLIFTVIILRIILKKDQASIKDLFSKDENGFLCIEDRVRLAGWIRGKYPKEASVIRLYLPKQNYVRKDHSVDLFKARQNLSGYIFSVLGAFRDYNGGMMAGQIKNLEALKGLLREEGAERDLVIENFFHALTPVEMRGVVSPFLLKSLYFLYKNSTESSPLMFQFLPEGLVIFGMKEVKDEKVRIERFVQEEKLSSSQVVRFFLQEEAVFGYIFPGLSKEKGEKLSAFFDEYLFSRPTAYF